VSFTNASPTTRTAARAWSRGRRTAPC